VASDDIDALVNWYLAQHMLKAEVRAKDIVERRYAIEMPK
jgi:hypothetical protein